MHEHEPVIAAPAPPTAGAYYSQARLGSEHLILPANASPERHEANLPTFETERAIGMAALPEAFQDQQLNHLTYAGMTSAEYAARHQDWLQEFAYINSVLAAIEAGSTSDDDEEEDEADKKSERHLVRVGK
jgi:hypothetical protein